MNFRFAVILFSLILVLGLAIVVRSFLSEPADSGSLIPGFSGVKSDQIDIVEIEKTEPPGLLKIEKRKEQWFITDPIQAKADTSAVNGVVNSLLKIKPTVFAELPNNLSLAGLQPPSLKVTLRQGDERSGTLNFGKVTYGNAKTSVVFMSTSARPNRPIAISRSDLTALFRDAHGNTSDKAGDIAKWIGDYRTKSVFPAETRMAGEDITTLKLSLPNKKKELVLSRSANGWKFDMPVGWGEADPTGDLSATPNTFTGVRPLIGALTSIQALNADDFQENPADLKQYGLNPDNPDLIRVDMQTRDGNATVFIGKKEAAAPSAASPGMPPPAGKVWVRIEGQTGVIRANAADLSGLLPVIENPDPLRDRTLLAIADKDKIDGLNITAGGQTTQLRKASGAREWKLFGNAAAGDPQPANDIAVKNLLDVLLEHRTIRSFPAANPANFTPADIKAEVKIWVDGFDVGTDPKVEPKEKNKPIVLLFGKGEGDSVYVRRTLPDGGVAEYLLPDKIKVAAVGSTFDLIPTVAKTRLELLDPNLKSFSSELVNKITLSGIKNFELERSEKKDLSTNKDRWTYASPPDQKGKTADAGGINDILHELGTKVTVSRYVDETPTPAKLTEYGLSPPKLKVVIGLKGTEAAEKERVYEFGAITGDFVYARQTGKVAVFTLPKVVYDKLVDTDLRDRDIFHFDPAQITKIEFRGWKIATGFVTELQFERKDGTWVVAKAPGNPGEYALDPSKVSAFLTLLNTTTVKTFIPGAIHPDQGFDEQKGSLGVNLRTKDGVLLAITIGNTTDNGSATFVWSSVLPQTSPVFTVDAERFKKYKDSPAAFTK